MRKTGRFTARKTRITHRNRFALLAALCFGAHFSHAQTAPSQQTPRPLQTPSAPIPAPIRDSGKAGATSNVNDAQAKTGHAIADIARLPRTIPSGRPVVGLALEGGGALGLAHIGVLKWMEENHIPVDRVAGTSMGALIGSLYASGLNPAQMEAIAESGDFLNIFTVAVPYTDVNFRRREDQRELPQSISIGLKGGPSLRNALIADAGLNAFLRESLFRYESSDLSYDKLPIPFRCVSTDLNTMEPVVFEGGPPSQAVRASISIPGVFSPVEYRGHYLVDGAIVDNLPSDIVRQDLHSDVVIGIQLDASAFSESDVSSIVSVFARAYSAGTARNEKVGQAGSDILLHVDSGKFSTGDYGKAKELVQLGYEAAARNPDALKKLALSDDDWQAYLADRASRMRPQPGRLERVLVEGGTPGAQAKATTDVAALSNEPMKAAAITQALRRVQGNGTYQASYETFNTANATPTEGTQTPGPDNGLKVHLSPVSNGPPFLLFGMDISASNSNISRTTFDFRLLNTDLGGFGSELRTDIRLGFVTQASTEYYRLLRPSGYYIKPQVGILRQPVYLWQNQVRISEHLQQGAGGSFEAGRTFNRNLQLSANYQIQVIRWHPVSGNDGTSPFSGNAQTAVAHISYDTTQSGVLSNTGYRLDVKAGALFNTVGSKTAPVFQAQVGKSFGLSANNTLSFLEEANTYFRRNVAEPLRFTVGGPLRLSASSVDEYRGTDTYISRVAFGRRIANLPSGYGEGLYAFFAYEGAEIWAPERSAILRQDGVVTLIGVTPIGAITLGGSIGDAGRRKIFFTFGRLF